MKNILLGLSALSVLGFASCTGTKKVIDLDQSSSRTIELKAGQTYTVNLRENPSTGYSWKTKTPNECAASVGTTSYKQDKAAPQMVGVGGTRSYEIKGEKAGTCTITFEQMPPGRSEAVQTKELKVIVK